MRNPFAILSVAAAAAMILCSAMASPAQAQFVGQPFWLSDPTSVCTYPGRSGCPVVEASEPLPYGATAEASSSGDVAAATATATLAGAASKFTYITGLQISGGGATGASVIQCTITGAIGGTETIEVGVIAGATLAIAPVQVSFAKPLQSSAVNTSIVASCPSFGSGNAHAAVSAQGFIR